MHIVGGYTVSLACSQFLVVFLKGCSDEKDDLFDPSFFVAIGRDRAIPRRIRFAPPSEMFTLCHYTVSRVKKLPITGSLEMFVSWIMFWST